MDRLRAMELFTRVVELGSFTDAARALRLPRATATTLVQALEARLDVKLLHRTTRRVSVTADGALFYEEATRLLRELGELEGRLAGATASPRGRLRVDVPAAAGRQVIAPALPGFCARYPELVVELGSGDRPVDLLDEGIDCVVRAGDLHDESLIARKLAALPVATFAAPAYLRAHGTPRDLDALAAHRFVNYFSSKTGRIFEVDFERDGHVTTLRPPHVVAANDADTWIALAVAGLGLLQTPCSPSVRDAVARGALTRVLPAWTSAPLPIFVLYPPARHQTARVRVFADWVAELYQGEQRAADAFVSRRGAGGRARSRSKAG